jgi:excinuclease ABC subunit B
VPQIRGQYAGDRSRKDVLVEHGFRLPSAKDNRPLTIEEFLEVVPQAIFVSATPGPFELAESDQVAEQIIRPTGLLDPLVEIRPTKGQIDDLRAEIAAEVAEGGRVLITTLTKKMSEDLTAYLSDAGVRVEYLHSDIDTIERIEILRDLRLGKFDVLVGINLLREGLDLPEVSLVVILDADKEGFLRSRSALIQTMGRAARNARGRVILYADSFTDSMREAVGVTQRRRAAQETYNEEHGIDPISVTKAVTDILGRLRSPTPEPGTRSRGTRRPVSATPRTAISVAPDDVQALAAKLTAAMEDAAEELRFEEAALLRDELHALLESVGDPLELALEADGDPAPLR